MLAEKIETIQRFGLGNTRFKDFVDIYSLSFRIKAVDSLVEAIKACFENRRTQYDKAKILQILNDERFQKNMENKFNRDFKNLGIKSADVIFEGIEQLIHKISASMSK